MVAPPAPRSRATLVGVDALPHIDSASGHPTAPHWTVRRTEGSAASLHDRPLPDPARPSIWIHRVRRPALVLGSTQDEAIVDRERAVADGIEVCRRRSGGGLVGLEPDQQCWIDVIVPSWSPLWDPDIGRATHFLGATWTAAVADLLGSPPGGGEPEVAFHRGPVIGREAGRIVCFAGIGPGEVTVGGRKVVGLSQRRTREAARFQCALTWRWNPVLLERYVDPQVLAGAGIGLGDLAVGLTEPDLGPAPDAIARAFVRHLPDPVLPTPVMNDR